MKAIKPNMKIWCLPPLGEGAIKALFNKLVAAAASVPAFGIKGEQDIIILFPADMMQHGIGSEILLEYHDFGVGVYYWHRKREDLQRLMANFGNVLKERFPKASIQCHACSVEGRLVYTWVSGQSATRKQVEQILETARGTLPELKRKAATECYCEANALDYKGACGHHNALARVEHVVKRGEEIVGTDDPQAFQSLADVYVGDYPDFLAAD